MYLRKIALRLQEKTKSIWCKDCVAPTFHSFSIAMKNEDIT